jgi:uncharacterized repeat protein (TIGR01451 family)
MVGRIVGVAVLLLGVLAGAALRSAPVAHAEGTKPFSITITHVECVDDCDATGLEAALEGHADFYAKVWINGVKQPAGSDDDDPSTPVIDDNPSIDPYWTLSTQIPDSVQNVPVSIQIWDYDSTSGDDLGDVSPRDDDNTLDFRVTYFNGRWLDHTGNEDKVDWPQSCATGDGGDDDEPRVKVCWDVNTLSTSADADGDSILDGWERNGYNADGDGTIDVDLPAMGATLGRKDLFLEIDCLADANHTHCPSQGALRSVVQSFADAPVANPDGSSGVQLHVDIGGFYGQPAGTATNVLRTGAGAGGTTGTFGNYGGGGDQIPETAANQVVDWDGNTGRAAANFFTLKNLAQARDPIFRYALFAHQTNYRRAANDCTSGWAKGIPGVNFLVTLGGTDSAGNPCWGTDAGGRSVGSQTQQAGTLMHEFGHTLGLQHGGGDGTNNKPNYLSVMNYSFQACGVPAVAPLPGNCDYSRISLPTLNEVLPPGLDECAGIGLAGAGPVDWDGVGGITGASCRPPTGNVSANVNGDFNDTNGNGTQDTGEAPTLGALPGFEDWNSLFYRFRTIDNYQSAGTPVDDEPDPTTIERSRAHLAELTRPELTVTTTGPANAKPGDTITYDTRAASTGRGPALRAKLVNTKPDASQDTYDLGTFTVGASTSHTATVTVPCTTADGTVLTDSATATGTDLLGNPVSGSATAKTTIDTPKLTLAKNADPTVNAGEAITNRITYENTGGGGADHVVITDVVPAGVYYSTALDTGAGPKPDSVTANADGTHTLTWNIGAVSGKSGPKTIDYTTRASLLTLPGTTVQNSAKATFTNANGCDYAPVTASATTTTTQVTPTRNPLNSALWLLSPSQWTDEMRARIQATDQRFDGADGSAPDGALSSAEVRAVLWSAAPLPEQLRQQLMTTYLNVATRRINASTRVVSLTTGHRDVHNVREGALFGAATLGLPVNTNTLRYTDAILILTEMNNNLSERY